MNIIVVTKNNKKINYNNQSQSELYDTETSNTVNESKHYMI